MIEALLLLLPTPQYIASGIAFACSLALLSAMMTLIYLVTRVPNFAQGTLVISGSLLTVYAIDRLFYEHRGSLVYLLVYIIVPVMAGLFVSVLSLAEYLLVVRPLRNRGIGDIGIMISTLAYDAILAGLLAILVVLLPGVHIKKLMNVDVRSLDILMETPIGLLYASDIVAPVTAVVLAIIMHYMLYKTKFGISLRASIENPNLARVIGIDVDKMYASAWLISGFLTGVIGAIVGFQLSSNYGGLNPTRTQYLFLISIFAGSVLGGMSSIYLSMLGGFIIGFTESILVSIVNNLLLLGLGLNLQLHAYRGLFSFLSILIVLIIAPQGLASLDWERILGLKATRGDVDGGASAKT